jgi:hypothetical protein
MGIELQRASSPRPPLREVPLQSVLPFKHGQCYATMSPGQWDTALEAAYDLGFIMLELDDDEQPRRAYQRGSVA